METLDDISFIMHVFFVYYVFDVFSFLRKDFEKLAQLTKRK